MQISPAIASERSAISRADSCVAPSSARAADERVGSARSDRGGVGVGLDHVAGARQQQRLLAIGDQQQRLQPAQHAIGAPVLRQLHRGAREVAVELFQPRLELLEQRDAVGGAAREAGQDLAVAPAAGSCAPTP